MCGREKRDGERKVTPRAAVTGKDSFNLFSFLQRQDFFFFFLMIREFVGE